MSARLDGKVAVVTGAARNVGAAIAEQYAREGAHVVIADVLDEEGRETADRINGLIGSEVVRFAHLDVTSAAEWHATLEFTRESFGRVDILVNNAGIAAAAPIVDMSEELWNRIMAVNVTGVFLGMKHAAPFMAAGGGGSIVNLGSVNSFFGEKQYGAYVASKGAVLMLTKNAAGEFVDLRIRANAICPGAINTAMATDFFELHSDGDADAADDTIKRFQPFGGLIDPSQIALLAVYLGSDESMAMTGSSLLIDNGLTANWDHF